MVAARCNGYFTDWRVSRSRSNIAGVYGSRYRLQRQRFRLTRMNMVRAVALREGNGELWSGPRLRKGGVAVSYGQGRCSARAGWRRGMVRTATSQGRGGGEVQGVKFIMIRRSRLDWLGGRNSQLIAGVRRVVVSAPTGRWDGSSSLGRVGLHSAGWLGPSCIRA